MMRTILGRRIGRRAILAGASAALMAPYFAKPSRADAKPFRISTPGSPDEWQSKALELFKKELNATAPGQFALPARQHSRNTPYATALLAHLGEQGTEVRGLMKKLNALQAAAGTA